MRKIRVYCLFILLVGYISPIIVSAEQINEYKLEESTEKHIDNSSENFSTYDSTAEVEPGDNSESVPELSNEIKKEKSVKVIVASGTFGTSKWQIDSSGALHVGSGEFIDTRNSSPWFSYRNQINKIVFDGPVKASSNSSNLFSNLDRVVEFDNLDKFDTSNVTLMRDMFSNTSSLVSLDLSYFDTSRVIDMGFMFSYASSLANLNLSSFNTSNVVYMRSMFFGTKNINHLDLSNFDTNRVEDMSGMFMRSGVKKLDISHFDTSNATDMSGMFSGLSLDGLDVSHFDTSQVTNMSAMFSWSQINTLNLSNFKTGRVKNMDEMFTGTQIESVDLSSFDTSNVKNMNSMFSNSKISSIDLSSFDTTNVAYMYDMFAEMAELKHINLGERYEFKYGVELPSPSSSLPYYGKWQRDHEGAVYTSEELATQYDGLTMSGNYYWAEKLPTLEVKDSTIYEGDQWDPQDNFVSATDEDGNILSFDPTMTTDTVDTTIPGSYEVTYTNNSVSKTVIVTVKENLETIEAKGSVIYINETWTAEDNFVSATNKDGLSIEFNDNMTADSVNTTIPGIYHVTYINGTSSRTIEVVVKENKESIDAKDTLVYVGDSWKGQDSFVSATDRDGNELSFNEAMLTGVVDTTIPGEYSIVYTNGQAEKKVIITVKENQASIQANDSSIKVGDVWKAEDNFQGATDKDGVQVDFKHVTVSGNVDTSKAGKYEITYTYDKVLVKVMVNVEEAIGEDNEKIAGNQDNVTNKTNTSAKNKSLTVNKDYHVLPKTGDHVNIWLIILGVLISTLSVVTFRLRKNFYK
ncbi:BspA family leucine-rich repeat surface protein [Enterococcus caccae]|uniref:Bacterial surface protein 26-residue n=1 Tax=Enterococcus caccae ATCC BAA-1240 TaxID=1158612 RepID=R3W9L3_9ENTE|nr:bacterial Ig-like domain-containing protein [Enterococcus caccae]EOL44147.1 bacterial surface protein 26-residue [Enterococcus caccae ATCC BAA-1240]EOT55421.1 hypothetical protein I580_03293 [Enterococcus caccae ATCC BAA-1240]OJG22836.1 surface protein [Enterococcus caccae]